jgi:ribosomal protein L11 methyltransferase
MALWRVALRAPAADAERLRARFLELAPEGFEERHVDGEVELALYADGEQLARAYAQLPDAEVARVEDGWDRAWRAFHHPVEVAGLWLGPPWERPSEPSRAVVIDPGQAFGTGAHPTTQLCVGLLAATTRRGALLDVGCGSGVLAIAALRLGFLPVVALDSDPLAVEATRRNAAANSVDVDVRLADALQEPLPAADVAVANVLLEPVGRILAQLDANEAITSGYLTGELPAHPGWSHVETRDLGGWAADRFRRQHRPAT